MHVAEQSKLLEVRSFQNAAHETFELSYVTQQECCEAEAAYSRVGGVPRINVQQSCAAGIARHAQIQGITDVCAEFERVVAARLRPVVNELKLLFAFG